MSDEELDPKALEAARKAVEDVLIEFRDARISVFGGNGFVVREKDGNDSHIMRLTTRQGLETGIKAYLRALPREAPSTDPDSPASLVAAQGKGMP